MATKDANAHIEFAHLQALFPYFPDHFPQPDSLIDLCERGWLQVSTVYEHVLAELGGFQVVSGDGRDFCNGHDAKLSTVRTSSRGRNYSAPVRKVHSKVGDLLVQVYERIHDQFYYFHIPNHSFAHISPTSNIEIPFELNGDPRRVNRCQFNWWDYEVPDLRTLARQAGCKPAIETV